MSGIFSESKKSGCVAYLQSQGDDGRKERGVVARGVRLTRNENLEETSNVHNHSVT